MALEIDPVQRAQLQRQALLATAGARGGALEAQQIQQPTPAVDTFFNSDPGLITVFDFDYERIIDFRKKLGWTTYALMFPVSLPTVVCCIPCYMNQNIEWKARAQHVALTVDGIRYVVDKHPSCCGLACSDKGREAKTVPYDKITDCDLQEPAGAACCCCVQRTLSQVRVDTASSGSKDGVPVHELVLEGLHYPTEFKQAVWSMKRGELPAATNVPMAAASLTTAAAPSQATMTNSLLAEIRDELRDLNTHLKAKA